MLNRILRAPWMLASSSGLAIAWRAASIARFSPLPRPRPIRAGPAPCHDRAHVGEVEVDETRPAQEVDDSSDRLQKDVVDRPERVEHRRVVGDHFGDAIVGDRDDRVDAGCQLGRGRVRDPSALSALEGKWLGDDRDRQRALDAGVGRDDRRRA